MTGLSTVYVVSKVDDSIDLRTKYQLTVGELIAMLALCSGNVIFDDGMYPGLEHAHVQYTTDLAFEPQTKPVLASSLLEICARAKYLTYAGADGIPHGIKDTTPVWKAKQNSIGVPIRVGVIVHNDLVLICDKSCLTLPVVL